VERHLTSTYYKFNAKSVLKKFLKSLKIWQGYNGKVDCIKCLAWWDSAPLKDEELARDLTGTVVTASHYY